VTYSSILRRWPPRSRCHSKVRRTGTVPTSRASIADYREVLGQLWLLNAPEARPSARAHDPDVADARRLLAAQALLCHELGADLAARVSRRVAAEWARLMQRCPWCGPSGVCHDADRGEEIALR
jgi:hypothetical protein